MFPYIVTFQNKLKGVIIQYIRKILGIIFTIHYPFFAFPRIEIFIVVKISHITFFLRDQISVEWFPIAINAFFSYKS